MGRAPARPRRLGSAQGALPQGARRPAPVAAAHLRHLRVAALRLRRQRRAAQGGRAQGGPRLPRQTGARRGPAGQAHTRLRARVQAPAALRRLLPLAPAAQRRAGGVTGGLVHRPRGGGAGRHRPSRRRGDHGHRLRGGRAALRPAHRRPGRRAALRGVEDPGHPGLRGLDRGRLPQSVPDDRAQLDAGPQLHDLHDRVAHQLRRQRTVVHGAAGRARGRGEARGAASLQRAPPVPARALGVGGGRLRQLVPGPPGPQHDAVAGPHLEVPPADPALPPGRVQRPRRRRPDRTGQN